MTKPPPLGEFERIARFFAPLAGPGALDLTDDVALIDGPAGEQYVLTTDTIIEGVDYFSDDRPFQIAQKLLRVNLSDIAAKGATPFGYLLTTVLPKTHGEAWLDAEASDARTTGKKAAGVTAYLSPPPDHRPHGPLRQCRLRDVHRWHGPA